MYSWIRVKERLLSLRHSKAFTSDISNDQSASIETRVARIVVWRTILTGAPAQFACDNGGRVGLGGGVGQGPPRGGIGQGAQPADSSKVTAAAS